MVHSQPRVSRYAARYRAARAYADLSQEELAEKLGVDAQTIKRRESGRQDPKKAEVIAVAAICGVPLEFMEEGWPGLQPDEVHDLLKQVLAAIRDPGTARAVGAAIQGLEPESSSPEPAPDPEEDRPTRSPQA